MPLLSIATNVALSSETEAAVLKALSAEVAAMLGKPESYVMTCIESGRSMTFAGSDAPCAYLELKSIGLPGERTTEFSQRLCQSVSEALKVESNRIYIEFADAERHLWGWDGRTF